MNICQVLIEKLSKDELRELCVAYDDGKLDIIMEQYLLPKDAENFPKGDRK